MIARNYAEALYDVGERHDEREAFAEAFDGLTALLEDEPRIRAFLETPKVEPQDKKRVLGDVLGSRVSELFLNFLRVLVDKRRQRLLFRIADEYHAVLDERLGRVHVDITLAREPDEAMRDEITGRLSEMLDRTIVPEIRVDPEILGGIVVRYGDRILDGSVRRRLQSLRDRMLASSSGE